eukprot:403346103
MRNQSPTDQINSLNDSRVYDLNFKNQSANISGSSHKNQSLDNPQILNYQNQNAYQDYQDLGVSPNQYYQQRAHLIDQNQLNSQSLNTSSLSNNFQINQTMTGTMNANGISQLLSNTQNTQPLSAFDRLYYSGLQRKASRERKSKQMQDQLVEKEMREVQKQPKISVISSEVAKTLRDRSNMASRNSAAHEENQDPTQNFNNYTDQQQNNRTNTGERSQERQKGKTNDFLQYSLEWQRLRDAKIQQAKVMQETKILEDSKPVHQANSKMMPDDYKGVVSGYYDQVNKFFEKKRIYMEIANTKPEAKPQINNYNPAANKSSRRSRSRSNNRQVSQTQNQSINLRNANAQNNSNIMHISQSNNLLINNYADFNEGLSLDNYDTVIEKQGGTSTLNKFNEYVGDKVEIRLMKKGIEYKNNLNHKRHEQIQEMLREGPTFQPKLISENDKYLKEKRNLAQQLEDGVVKSKEEIGNQFYCQAMVFLMNKQQKIIENQKQLYEQPRIPKMSQKSIEITQNQHRKPIYEKQTVSIENKKGKGHNFKEDVQKQDDPEVQARKRVKMQEFIKRNYEKELRAKQLKSEQIKKDLESIEKLKEQGVSFQPKLSNGTMNLITQRQKRQTPTFEELYREANIKRQKHKEQIEKREKEVIAQELQDATFKPNINKDVTVLDQKKPDKSSYANSQKRDQYQKIQLQKKEVKDKQLSKQQKDSKNSSYLQMYYKNQFGQQVAQTQSDLKKAQDMVKYVSFNENQEDLSNKNDISTYQDKSPSQQTQNYQEQHIKQQQKQTLSKQLQFQNLQNLNAQDNNRRRSSELNKTIESNLLDFNEEKFMEDTKNLGQHINVIGQSSGRSSISNNNPSGQLQNNEYGQLAQNQGAYRNSFHQFANSTLDTKNSSNSQKSLVKVSASQLPLQMTETKRRSEGNDVIEGFLNEMQLAATQNSANFSQPTMEKIIEDARRALLEYDDSSSQIEQFSQINHEIIQKQTQKLNNTLASNQNDGMSNTKNLMFIYDNDSSLGVGMNQDFNPDYNQELDSILQHQKSIDQHTPIKPIKSPKSDATNLMPMHSSDLPSTNTKNILEQDQFEDLKNDQDFSQEDISQTSQNRIQPFNPPSSSQNTSQTPTQQSTSILERNQNTMNKTLSLIEEESQEEFFTNNDDQDRQSSYTNQDYPRGSLNAINQSNNAHHSQNHTQNNTMLNTINLRNHNNDNSMSNTQELSLKHELMMGRDSFHNNAADFHHNDQLDIIHRGSDYSAYQRNSQYSNIDNRHNEGNLFSPNKQEFNNDFDETRKLNQNDFMRISDSKNNSKRLDESDIQNKSRTVEVSHHIKSAQEPQIPNIVRDIENMEKDFTKFLEQIYN